VFDGAISWKASTTSALSSSRGRNRPKIRLRVLLDLVIRDPIGDSELNPTDRTLTLRNIQTCWCLIPAQELGGESKHIRLARVVLSGQQVDLAERPNQREVKTVHPNLAIYLILIGG
jgi:hypothetical protein